MNVQDAFPPNTQITAISQEPDRIYTINIRAVDRGYMVEVGCKTFAISETSELISHLTEYLKDPAKTHKKFFAGELFKKTTK